MRLVLPFLAATLIAAPSREGTEPLVTRTPAPAATPGPATKARLSNTVRWQTATELNNFGFDVYRSNDEKGPFVRLTSRPIPAGGTTDEPRNYAWVDDSIEPGQTYWYYVESISLVGERERFTPTFKAPVKGAPAPAPKPAQPPPTPR